ncbi:hypothetical protein [Xylocopilactobacillus apis]|uniref:DUF4367 domain-containing protein n=1 Tax=Xylocopilactobacillus apis TaxID=2932183 RepID=A0AAU9D6T5_9LACO|nr:hypothetical protein [Xylocopilactobacillus apis]BDR57130.1 hypothetical protein KIMC2_16920 [Xylocopilactobacillus apis]
MKNVEQPVTKLSDQELDKLIEEMDTSFNSKNQKNIHDRLHKKMHKRPISLPRATKWLVAAAALVILVPGTALAANGLWEAVTHKDGFLTTLVFKNGSQDNSHYKVNYGYLPSNLKPMAHTDGLKYYDPKDEDYSLSTVFYKPKNDAKLQVPNSGKTTKKIINNNVVYFVDHAGGDGESSNVFVAFEKEHRIVQLYFGPKVTKESIEKIVGGLSLKATSAKLATFESPANESHTSNDNVKSQTLRADSSTIKQFKTSFTQEVGEKDQIKIEPLSVNVGNEISKEFDLKKDVNIIDEKFLDRIIADKGVLKPFEGEVHKRGDGKNTIDRKIKNVTVQPKFYEVTVKITNDSSKPISHYDFNAPRLYLLEPKGNNLVLDMDVYTSPYNNFENYPNYVLPRGIGSGQKDYNKSSGTIEPHTSKTFKYGYVVINPMDYKPFLQFDSAGRAPDDLNSNQYRWLKLP